MKAAVLEEIRKPLVVRDVPDPQCPPNGVVVKTSAEGICRCDWHIWSGDWSWVGLTPPLPHVMGHEFCGVVVEVGKEVKNFIKGDRVLVPFSQGDGTCEYCRTGRSHICLAPAIPGITYWGGYAEYVGIPSADVNLIHMPEGVSDLAGASMGCRYMTAYHGIVNRVAVRPGEWVVVHGCGGAGLAAIQISTAIGANVIGVDIDDRKLEMAKSVGAAHVLNANKVDVLSAIADITQGGAHVAVDALGIAATSRNAIMSLRKQGRALQMGFTGQDEMGEIAMPIDMIILMELQLVGTLGMPTIGYTGMLQMVQAGKLKPQALVTGVVTMNDATSVFEKMTDYSNVGITIMKY